MRRLRVTIVLVFVLSVIAFIAYNVLARMVEDHTPPVITCDSDTVTVSVEDDDSALFQGMTAEDNRDGDLTDSIRVSSMSNFTEPGKRTANYAVFDSSNQVATYSRTVEYTDYTSPQIQLSEPLRFSMEQMEDINLAENMTVQDCLDGDISSQIRATFSDNAYISQAGNYEVTVQVSNSAGDTCSVPLTVTVTDSSDDEEMDKYYPVLSQYIVYTNVGKSVDLNSLVIGLERNGSEYLFEDDNSFLHGERGDVQVSGSVDYKTAGTYTVDYTFTTEDDVSATTKLAVVVR
mgnify:FL=1